MLDEKNDWHGLDTLYTVQILGKIVQRTRAGCRCENIVFVCRSAFCHASRRRAVRSRGNTLSRFCVAVYGSILMLFSAFFSEGIALSDGLDSSHFIAMWCHNFL